VNANKGPCNLLQGFFICLFASFGNKAIENILSAIKKNVSGISNKISGQEYHKKIPAARSNQDYFNFVNLF
jgi:hypothetical protein